MATTKPIQMKVWGQNLVSLRVLQGEVNSRNLEITLIDAGGTLFALEGYTAQMYIVESSGRKIFSDATVDDNTIVAKIPELVSVGEAQAQIVLTNADSEELKIPGITIYVEKSDLDGAVEASDEWSALADMIDDAQSATNAANAAAADVLNRAESGEFDGDSGTIDATTNSTFTGILKGNGEKVVQAVPGTDYATPAQVDAKQDTITATGILKGDGSGGISAATAGADYATPAQVNAKQNTITATGLLKGGGSGSVSAAISGTDYTPGTPTSTTITIAFSNGESVNLKAYKLGRLIMYPGSVWVDKSNVTEGKVGTIPVGYRPVENFTLCPPSNLGYGGYIQFRTNGDIYIGQLMEDVRFAGFICNINYIAQ